jgi:spermidine synthase
MTLELIAGRLLAPQIGVSLYTWTTIIGVVFAGMSLGNALGGWLSDRYATRARLGWLYVLAGAGALWVLALDALIGNIPIWIGLPTLPRIGLIVLLVFLPPGVLLGVITPFVAKLAMRDLSASGGAIGRVYAASALGSILGTFATGYVLQSYLGVQQILLLIAAVLGLLGIGVLLRWRSDPIDTAVVPIETSTVPATEAVQPAALGLRSALLIVFVSNLCIMVVQLVASRMASPSAGVSLYTWTSLIGVMLAGLSVGNWLSGRMADSMASRPVLSALLFFTGLSLLWVLFMFWRAGGIPGLPNIEGVPLVLRLLLFYTALFFVPSVLLGTISPMVIKLAVADLRTAGSTVGRIATASTIGNILGTFATGYVLISAFGTRPVLFGTGVTLILLSVWVLGWRTRTAPGRLASAATVAALLAAPLTPANALLRGPCLTESNYFCIRVRDDKRDDTVYRVLTLDRLVHSYHNTSDPLDMRYTYEQVGAEVTDFLAARDGQIRAFFIGGGGYSLPHYVELTQPNAQLDVSEIDPAVTEVAHSHMGLPRQTRIRTINQDARLWLATAPAEVRYNFVLGDAFNDFSVPYHLTTHEFNQLVRAHMSDDGIYMLNLIDGGDLPFVSAFVKTLGQTFAHVTVIANPDTINGRTQRNTFVVLASDQPIDTGRLSQFPSADGSSRVAGWVATPAQLEMLGARAPVTLSDDFVPTDRLLTPTFDASGL